MADATSRRQFAGSMDAAAARRFARARSVCSPKRCRCFRLRRRRWPRGVAFAAPPREVWLEIGFGAGEHLIEQAKANPDVEIVGCEPFLNGVVAALAGIKREQLSNVRLRRGDAQSAYRGSP